MNIIIVSELFNPQKSIGAVRLYNFATELAAMGHKVFCVISANEEMPDSAETCNLKLFPVPDGSLGMKRTQYEKEADAPSAPKAERTVAAAPVKPSAIQVWLRGTAAQAWVMAAEYERYRNACRICSKIMDQEHIDLLLTSYGPIANLQVGLKMKKKYPRIPWVSDMRDPADSGQLQFFWRQRGAFLQKKMLYRADKVVTVCDGISDRFRAMLPEHARGKVVTITNGYREEPALAIPAEDGVLRIGYTGDLYIGKRDMSELFRCLWELEQRKGMRLPVEVHHAGPDSGTILEQARKYNAEKYVVIHGKVSKAESLRLQERCDILCVLTWNTKQEQGVLTGKFMEYLRLRKPILAIVTGDLENAEVSRRIDDMNIGFSYECIRKDSDFGKMKNWLTMCLEKKKKGLPLLDAVNEEKVCAYSYKQLAKQYEVVLNNSRKALG